MSEPDPIDSSDEPAGRFSDPPTTAKPDWLVGADEGTDPQADESADASPASGRSGSEGVRPTAPMDRARPPAPHLKLVPAKDPPPPPPPDSASDEPAEAEGPVAWKAAASSVPKLRQQPAASTLPSEPESFPGFAQDAMMARTAAVGGRAAEPTADLNAPGLNEDAMPLAENPPFWAEWLDRLRMLPRPVVIGASIVLLLGAATYVLWPRGNPGVSLAQIRQHPEAFEGRLVRVGGKAGETFSVGDSYVFNLCQGRDTIVVYSRLRRPRLHERVKVEGTVSIGYLEGEPRVALLESSSAP